MLSSFALPEYAYKPEYKDMKAFKRQDAIAGLQLIPTPDQTILLSQKDKACETLSGA